MAAQRAYYKTNVEEGTCQCGLTEYFTKIFDMFCPCCHLLDAGLERPVMDSPPVLVSSDDPFPFHLETSKVTRQGEEPSAERTEALIRIAAHSIKQQSRTGVDLGKIIEWMTERFPAREKMREFVQNILISILKLMTAGVLHYNPRPLAPQPIERLPSIKAWNTRPSQIPRSDQSTS
jgi:hypothetical protein